VSRRLRRPGEMRKSIKSNQIVCVLVPGSRMNDWACEYAASLNGVTGSGRSTSTADGPIVAESRCTVWFGVLDVSWGSDPCC